MARAAGCRCTVHSSMSSSTISRRPVITIRATPRLWLPVLIFLATLASSSRVLSSTADNIKSLDLNLILQRLEEAQHQDPAQSRPYEVTREYKVFRGDEKQPTSEVMAQINFVPPATKTYKITQAQGNSSGEKMVRALLGSRVAAAFFHSSSHNSYLPCSRYRRESTTSSTLRRSASRFTSSTTEEKCPSARSGPTPRRHDSCHSSSDNRPRRG
jgi:hypothetical protein